MSEIQRIGRRRPLSGEESARYDAIRKQVDAELPEILARNAAAPGHASAEDVEETRQLVAFFRAERERQGLQLSDIVGRTRYKLEDLEALEQDRLSYPSLAMLTRFARALGKRIILALRQGEAWRDPRAAEMEVGNS